LKAQIPWLRVFVEGVVIVGSILLALTLDAWWDGVQEREEETELLLGLRQEFIENRQILQGTLVLVEEGVADLRRFVGLTPDQAAQIPSDSAWARVIVPHRRVFSSGLSVGFLDATVGSGKLALIRDSNLRAALARTSGIQEDLAEVLAYALELSLEAATLMGRYPEIQIAYVAVEGKQEIAASTLRALRSDTEFMGVSTAKSYYWGAYLNELRRLEAHVDLVVAMIDAALG